MCMDFINDNVWCIIDCLYQVVPDVFLCISMIEPHPAVHRQAVVGVNRPNGRSIRTKETLPLRNKGRLG